jgi:hypothetical protein
MIIAAHHGSFTQGELALDADAQPSSAERRLRAVEVRTTGAV